MKENRAKNPFYTLVKIAIHHQILSTGRVAQRITRLTTDQKIAGSNPAEIVSFLDAGKRWRGQNDIAPPGGLEPPTFRLTAERASRLRHGGMVLVVDGRPVLEYMLI